MATIGTVDLPSEPIPVVSQETRVYIHKCDGRIYGNERHDSQSMPSRLKPGDPAVKNIPSYSALEVSPARLPRYALLEKCEPQAEELFTAIRRQTVDRKLERHWKIAQGGQRAVGSSDR